MRAWTLGIEHLDDGTLFSLRIEERPLLDRAARMYLQNRIKHNSLQDSSFNKSKEAISSEFHHLYSKHDKTGRPFFPAIVRRGSSASGNRSASMDQMFFNTMRIYENNRRDKNEQWKERNKRPYQRLIQSVNKFLIFSASLCIS